MIINGHDQALRRNGRIRGLLRHATSICKVRQVAIDDNQTSSVCHDMIHICKDYVMLACKPHDGDGSEAGIRVLDVGIVDDIDGMTARMMPDAMSKRLECVPSGSKCTAKEICIDRSKNLMALRNGLNQLCVYSIHPDDKKRVHMQQAIDEVFADVGPCEANLGYGGQGTARTLAIWKHKVYFISKETTISCIDVTAEKGTCSTASEEIAIGGVSVARNRLHYFTKKFVGKIDLLSKKSKLIHLSSSSTGIPKLYRFIGLEKSLSSVATSSVVYILTEKGLFNIPASFKYFPKQIQRLCFLPPINSLVYNRPVKMMASQLMRYEIVCVSMADASVRCFVCNRSYKLYNTGNIQFENKIVAWAIDDKLTITAADIRGKLWVTNLMI